MRVSHLNRPAFFEPSGSTPVSRVRPTPIPWLWLVGGATLFSAVPFIGTDMFGLQPDLFYLGYFTIAVAWFAAFYSTYRTELRNLWRLNLRWSLAVGAVAGFGVAAIVFSSAGTDHPDGWRWWFEIGWRGVVYGSVDALTLFVFPAAVAYLLIRGDRTGAKRKIGYGGLVLAFSLLVSASYHLGYTEYRDSDLRSPLIGTVMADSAAVLTGNPVGAFLTHVPAHVSAVVHQEEGGPTHMLPPKVTPDYPSHGDSDLAAALAALWLLGTAGALTVLVRRQRTTEKGGELREHREHHGAHYEAAHRAMAHESVTTGVVVHGIITLLVSAGLIVINLTLASEFPWSAFAVGGMLIGLLAHWWFGYVKLDDQPTRQQQGIEARAAQMR